MYNIPVGIPVTFIHSCCSAYTYSSLQGAFKVGIVVIISSNPDWLNRTVSFSGIGCCFRLVSVTYTYFYSIRLWLTMTKIGKPPSVAYLNRATKTLIYHFFQYGLLSKYLALLLIISLLLQC